MTEFGVNFYVSSNFFNILNTFSNPFPTMINDWLYWNEDYFKTVLN